MTHNYASPLGRTLVVKYGGNAFADPGQPDPVLSELALLQAGGARIVLVHGGGPEIDAALARDGTPTARVEGLRITDERSLEIIEALLCGTINKRFVRACAAVGMRAVGLSGQDDALLVAGFARSTGGASLGYVGHIVATNTALLDCLLDRGLLPIIAPLAVARDGTHALNVNADFAAAALAAALRADAFIAITNVARVLRDPADERSGIAELSLAEASAFERSDACRAGMKPKLAAAIEAVRGGCAASYICAAMPGAIAGALDRGEATRIASTVDLVTPDRPVPPDQVAATTAQ